MNHILKWTLIVVLLILTIGCMAFVLVNLDALWTSGPDPLDIEYFGEINHTIPEVSSNLLKAPWQGVRYIQKEQTWRFYGVVGETKQIDLIHPINLIKVYYLGADGGLNFTWAATEIQFPGKSTFSLTSQPLREGQLIAVQLKGAYVNQNGVDWEGCDSDYCHLAQMIDTMLVLDDQGTGVSNGFIRYGWEPPTYPYYGFLCWQIESVEYTQEIFMVANKRI
jgi:hypothetical protein